MISENYKIFNYYISLEIPIQNAHRPEGDIFFFTIALRVIVKKTITCVKPMRVRFVLLEVFQSRKSAENS